MKSEMIAAFLLVAVAGSSQGQSRLFKGEIMDIQCATMGTHDRMMKGVNAKDAAECSRKCVKMRGKYVLFDLGTNTIYQIDNQEKSAQFAGQKVSVKGTYNADSKTIHVESMRTQSFVFHSFKYLPSESKTSTRALSRSVT